MRKPIAIAVVVLSSLVLLRGVFLAGFIPPFHGPDEPAHFDYVQRLAENRALPNPSRDCTWTFSPEVHEAESRLVAPIVFQPDSAVPPLGSVVLPQNGDADRATNGCNSAAGYPPAYYAVAALGYAAFSGGNLYERQFGARLASVLCALVTVLAGFTLGWAFFGRTRDGLLVGLLFALQPMLTFLSAVVNNDALLFATSTAAFAAIAVAWRTGRTSALVALSLIGCIGSLSKNTFHLMLPVLFVFCVGALGPLRRRAWLTAAAALALPMLTAIAWNVASPSNASNFLDSNLNPLTAADFLRDYVFRRDRLMMLWGEMYWMNWGWLDTRVHPVYHSAIYIIAAVAAVGLIIGFTRAPPQERWFVILALAATAAVMVLMYLLEFRMLRRYGALFIQGRYLLPLFPIHALLLVIGLRWMAERLRMSVNLAWFALATLAVVNAAALVRALARYYA